MQSGSHSYNRASARQRAIKAIVGFSVGAGVAHLCPVTTLKILPIILLFWGLTQLDDDVMAEVQLCLRTREYVVGFICLIGYISQALLIVFAPEAYTWLVKLAAVIVLFVGCGMAVLRLYLINE
jgi:hypothetical protein